jgi:cation diffusion facilitator family transporter
MSQKTQIARLSILSNTLLIILKFIVGFISGSVSIISEAIHSVMDLIAAVIAFFSVKYSDDPPDKEHPYGHGKIENVSGVIEALLITVAAVWIIYEAFHKIIAPKPIENVEWGALVMVISAVTNFFVAQKLYKTAKETESVALKADGLHLMTDVYTSLGVALGLVSIWIFNIQILDPIVAILVALFILFKSFDMLKEAFLPLIDTCLNEEEIQIINDSISKRSISFHKLKTRRAGSYRFAELHLELNENMSLKDAHSICDEIENEIQSKIKHLDMTIHMEPITKKPE